MDEIFSNRYGNGEGEQRVMVARHDIKITSYGNKSSLSFEKYLTHLKKVFTTLATYEQPESGREKVEFLLSQINTNNVKLTIAT